MNNFNEQLNQKEGMPLYPNEAYQKVESSQKKDEKNDQNSVQNSLLPLLLSAMQGGENLDIAKLLPLISGDNANAGLISALASGLNKNKKKESPKTSELSVKKPFPKNEFIY